MSRRFTMFQTGVPKFQGAVSKVTMPLRQSSPTRTYAQDSRNGCAPRRVGQTSEVPKSEPFLGIGKDRLKLQEAAADCMR